MNQQDEHKGALAAELRKELEPGGLKGMLYELLDNARRSGARHIAIDVAGHGAASEVRVKDDGRGLAGPQPLVEYGRVAWGTGGYENALGRGFQALGGAWPHVMSRAINGEGWETVLTPEEFEKQQASAAKLNKNVPNGMTVTVTVELDEHHARQIAQEVARYQTVDVYIDGTHANQTRYTNGSLGRTAIQGYRFGVFPRARETELDLNAHGRLVAAELPTVTTPEGTWSIVADIEAWPEELVVDAGRPPRLVDNAAAGQLRLTAERVILGAIAATAQGPSLTTGQIERAEQLGITIAGRPLLQTWSPRICEVNDSAPPIGRPRHSVADDALIVRFETPQPARDGQMLSRAMAHDASKKRLALFEPNNEMQGQWWYDQLDTITGLRAMVSVDGVEHDADDETASAWTAQQRRVDAIRVEIDVKHPDGTMTVMNIATDVALGGGAEAYETEEKEVFLSAGTSIDVKQLGALIGASSIGRYDNDRGDSRESQERDFTMRADYRAAQMLLDRTEADRRQIATATRNELLRRIEREPLDETIHIRIKGANVEVDFESEAEAT